MKLPGAVQGGVPGHGNYQANTSTSRGLKDLGDSLGKLGMNMAQYSHARNKQQRANASFELGNTVTEGLMGFDDPYVDASKLESSVRGERSGEMLGAEAKFLQYSANSEKWIRKSAEGIENGKVREAWINEQLLKSNDDKASMAKQYSADFYTSHTKRTKAMVDSYLEVGDYKEALGAAADLLDSTDRELAITKIKQTEQVDYVYDVMNEARNTGDVSGLASVIEEYETKKRGADLSDPARYKLASQMRALVSSQTKTNTIQMKLVEKRVHQDLTTTTARLKAGKPISALELEQNLAQAANIIMMQDDPTLIGPVYDAVRANVGQSIFHQMIQAEPEAFGTDNVDIAMTKYFDEVLAGTKDLDLPEELTLGQDLFTPVQQDTMVTQIKEMYKTFQKGLATDFVGTMAEYQIPGFTRLDIGGDKGEYYAGLFARKDWLAVERERYGVFGEGDVLTNQEREHAINFYDNISPGEAIDHIMSIEDALGDSADGYYNDLFEPSSKWANTFAVGGDILHAAGGSDASKRTVNNIMKGQERIDSPDSQFSAVLEDTAQKKSWEVTRDLGTILNNTGQEKAYENAYWALWAQRNVEEGKQINWTKSRHRDVIRQLVGEYGKYAGATIRSPSFDFDFEEYSTWLENMSADVVQAGGGVTGSPIKNTTAGIAEMIRDGDLIPEESPNGRNKLLFRLPGEAKKYMMSETAGQPLEITFDESLYKQQIEAGRAERRGR